MQIHILFLSMLMSSVSVQNHSCFCCLCFFKNSFRNTIRVSNGLDPDADMCPNCFSSTDKQHICLNTQLKSSKKQLKFNACVPKSNSFERYAITCAVIAYHLVHFSYIWVIHKCQSVLIFLLACAQKTPVLWIKY